MGKALLISLWILLFTLWTTSCGGGSGSSGSSGGGNNPQPNLVSFAPFRATAGGADFELGIRGSNLVAASEVTWNGSSRPTTFVDSGHLKVSVPALDIANAGVAQIQVINPSPGAGSSAKLRFGIFSATPERFFLYSSTGTNTVWGYSADGNTGVLTELPGSPVMSTPLNASSGPLLSDGLGGYLFVENLATSGCKDCQSLSEFSMDSTGSLSPIRGSPFPWPSFPGDLLPATHDPSGNILYSGGVDAGNNQTVNANLIDADSGVLTRLATGTLPAGLSFLPTALHPSGAFVYGISAVVGIMAGSISPTTGQVSLVSGSPFGDMTFDQMAVDPSGKYGFAISLPSTDGGTLVTFAIDQTTGGLSILNSNTVLFPDTFGGVLAHPTREFLYVSNLGTNTILAYSIAADGSLSPIAGSPFATEGINPSRMVTDANGKFLYVGNGSLFSQAGSISGFMVDQTSGALTPVAGTPLAIDGNPSGLAVGK